MGRRAEVVVEGEVLAAGGGGVLKHTLQNLFHAGWVNAGGRCAEATLRDAQRYAYKHLSMAPGTPLQRVLGKTNVRLRWHAHLWLEYPEQPSRPVQVPALVLRPSSAGTSRA